jgi:hypothetical protein
MPKTENVHEGCEPRRKANSDYKERFRERFYEDHTNAVMCKKHKIHATPFEILTFIEEEKQASYVEGNKAACEGMYERQEVIRAEERKHLIGVVDEYVDSNVEDAHFNRYWLKAHLRNFLKTLSDSSEEGLSKDRKGVVNESGIQEEGFRIADENLKYGEVETYKEHPIHEETECWRLQGVPCVHSRHKPRTDGNIEELEVLYAGPNDRTLTHDFSPTPRTEVSEGKKHGVGCEMYSEHSGPCGSVSVTMDTP